MILENIARNASVDGVAALHNGGTMVYETVGDVAVATLGFSATAYAGAVAGVAQENAISSDADAAGGVVDHVSFYTSGAAKISEATVSAPSGGGEVEITGGLTIGAGAVVSCSDLPITQPAS